MVNWILGNQTPTVQQIQIADSNGDGSLNTLDVIQFIHSYMYGDN